MSSTWTSRPPGPNPLSALVQSCRQLFGNPAAVPRTPSLPLEHPYLFTVGWAVVLLAVFAPLAVRAYVLWDR
jgi:ABC-2 type transport system permease protein